MTLELRGPERPFVESAALLDDANTQQRHSRNCDPVVPPRNTHFMAIAGAQSGFDTALGLGFSLNVMRICPMFLGSTFCSDSSSTAMDY